jgi:hypothetical protein
MYKMINSGPGAGASNAQTAYWSGLTEELGHIDKDLNDALGKLQTSWQGLASADATTAINPLQQWAGDTQTATSVMRISSEDQANFVSTARAEMPKPVEVTTPAPSGWQQAGAGVMAVFGNPGPALAVVQQSADHEAQEAAQAAAAQKAVDTMETYESNSTWNRNTLGTFVPPPDFQISTNPPSGSSSSGGQIGSWMSSGTYSGPSGGTQTSSITTPPSTGTGSTGTGGRTLPPTTSGGSAPVVSGGTTTPSTFTPTPPPTGGAFPDPTTLPPGGGGGNNPTYGGPPRPGGNYPLPTTSLPTGSQPGELGGRNTQPGLRGTPGLGGAGGPESGSGARPGTGGLGTGGPGAEGSRPGAQVGRGLGAPAGEGGLGGRGGAAGPGGAGARGSGGLGSSPMGGGAGTPGEEDEERFSPDYLLETTGVFDDDRMVSPAVIGEEPKTEES